MFLRRMFLCAAPLLLIAACNDQSPSTLEPLSALPAASSASGQVRLTASLPKDTSARVRPGDVVDMRVAVTWSGGGTAPIEMFEVAPGQYQVTVLNLPAGIPVSISVSGHNEGGVAIYSGARNNVMLSDAEILDLSVVLVAMDNGQFEGAGPSIVEVRRPLAPVLANSIIQFEVDIEHPDDATLDYELSGPGVFQQPSGSIAMTAGAATLIATYTAPATPGQADLSVVVTDSAGLSAEVGFSLDIIAPAGGVGDGGATIGAIFPPAILGINAEQDFDNNVIRLTADVEQVGGGEPLTFDWRLSTTSFSTTNPAEYPMDQGVVPMMLVVGNSAGGATRLIFQLDTSAATLGDLGLPNQPPTIGAAVVSQPEPSYPDPVLLRVYASDPDVGDDLSAAWTADHGSLGAATESTYGGYQVFDTIWNPDVDAGPAQIQVTISDPLQAAVVYTFNLDQILGRVSISADAGANQEKFVDDGATLDGSASTSDDGNILSYMWSRLSGPAATIDTPDAATTSVAFDGGPGTYVFELTVENVNSSSVDTVTINVLNPFAFDYVKVEMTNPGVVYFFDTAGDRIHRYDLATESFMPNLTVGADAQKFAVAPANDIAYVGYTGGRIEKIDLATGAASLFTSVPTTPILLEVVDNYLWTIDSSGSWETHRLFRRSDGVQTFSDDWRNSSLDGVYAPTISRVFHFRDGTSPNDIIYADVDLVAGTLGTDHDSPYHGDYSFQHPMRLSTDESKVMVASGVLFNTSDLTYAGSIGFSYTDAQFYGSSLYVLQSAGSGSQVRELDAGFNERHTYTMAGAPRSLLAWQGKILAVTNGANGTRNFTLIHID
ncbi:MAG TPA: hypothetical protein P5081_17560 [Phycisphaerae bacterium]|nr:hypothetical protein [Phycisphaerae bacterium]HRW54680.1 hypothetical protein [Phycisphaerae bacterium]